MAKRRRTKPTTKKKVPESQVEEETDGDSRESLPTTGPGTVGAPPGTTQTLPAVSSTMDDEVSPFSSATLGTGGPGNGQGTQLAYFWCHYCDFSTDVKTELVAHIQQHKIKCPHCPFNSLSRADVTKHCKAEHGREFVETPPEPEPASSSSDYTMDKDPCSMCCFCDFMTYSTGHLEHHTAQLHPGFLAKSVAKMIPKQTSASIRQADALFYNSGAEKEKKKSVKRVEIDLDPSSPDIQERKPVVDKLKLKTEFPRGSKPESESAPIKPSGWNVKVESMYCMTCPYSNVSASKLRCHTITQHPLGATVATFNSTTNESELHELTFFCVKESCNHVSTELSQIEEHLILCCPLSESLSKVERERLVSTLDYINDLHRKNDGDKASGFSDYCSDIMGRQASSGGPVQPQATQKSNDFRKDISNISATCVPITQSMPSKPDPDMKPQKFTTADQRNGRGMISRTGSIASTNTTPSPPISHSYPPTKSANLAGNQNSQYMPQKSHYISDTQPLLATGFQQQSSTEFQQPLNTNFSSQLNAGFQQNPTIDFQQQPNAGYHQQTSEGFQQSGPQQLSNTTFNEQNTGYHQQVNPHVQQNQNLSFQQQQSVGFQQPNTSIQHQQNSGLQQSSMGQQAFSVQSNLPNSSLAEPCPVTLTTNSANGFPSQQSTTNPGSVQAATQNTGNSAEPVPPNVPQPQGQSTDGMNSSFLNDNQTQPRVADLLSGSYDVLMNENNFGSSSHPSLQVASTTTSFNNQNTNASQQDFQPGGDVASISSSLTSYSNTSGTSGQQTVLIDNQRFPPTSSMQSSLEQQPDLATSGPSMSSTGLQSQPGMVGNPQPVTETAPVVLDQPDNSSTMPNFLVPSAGTQHPDGSSQPMQHTHPSSSSFLHSTAQGPHMGQQPINDTSTLGQSMGSAPNMMAQPAGMIQSQGGHPSIMPPTGYPLSGTHPQGLYTNTAHPQNQGHQANIAHPPEGSGLSPSVYLSGDMPQPPPSDWSRGGGVLRMPGQPAASQFGQAIRHPPPGYPRGPRMPASRGGQNPNVRQRLNLTSTGGRGRGRGARGGYGARSARPDDDVIVTAVTRPLAGQQRMPRGRAPVRGRGRGGRGSNPIMAPPQRGLDVSQHFEDIACKASPRDNAFGDDLAIVGVTPGKSGQPTAVSVNQFSFCCVHCGDDQGSKEVMKRHMRSRHNDSILGAFRNKQDGRMLFFCPQLNCEFMTYDEGRLTTHLHKCYDIQDKGQLPFDLPVALQNLKSLKITQMQLPPASVGQSQDYPIDLDGQGLRDNFGCRITDAFDTMVENPSTRTVVRPPQNRGSPRGPRPRQVSPARPHPQSPGTRMPSPGRGGMARPPPPHLSPRSPRVRGGRPRGPMLMHHRSPTGMMRSPNMMGSPRGPRAPMRPPAFRLPGAPRPGFQGGDASAPIVIDLDGDDHQAPPNHHPITGPPSNMPPHLNPTRQLSQLYPQAVAPAYPGNQQGMMLPNTASMYDPASSVSQSSSLDTLRALVERAPLPVGCVESATSSSSPLVSQSMPIPPTQTSTLEGAVASPQNLPPTELRDLQDSSSTHNQRTGSRSDESRSLSQASASNNPNMSDSNTTTDVSVANNPSVAASQNPGLPIQPSQVPHLPTTEPSPRTQPPPTSASDSQAMAGQTPSEANNAAPAPHQTEVNEEEEQINAILLEKVFAKVPNMPKHLSRRLVQKFNQYALQKGVHITPDSKVIDEFVSKIYYKGSGAPKPTAPNPQSTQQQTPLPQPAQNPAVQAPSQDTTATNKEDSQAQAMSKEKENNSLPGVDSDPQRKANPSKPPGGKPPQDEEVQVTQVITPQRFVKFTGAFAKLFDKVKEEKPDEDSQGKSVEDKETGKRSAQDEEEEEQPAKKMKAWNEKYPDNGQTTSQSSHREQSSPPNDEEGMQVSDTPQAPGFGESLASIIESTNARNFSDAPTNQGMTRNHMSEPPGFTEQMNAKQAGSPDHSPASETSEGVQDNEYPYDKSFDEEDSSPPRSQSPPPGKNTDDTNDPTSHPSHSPDGQDSTMHHDGLASDTASGSPKDNQATDKNSSITPKPECLTQLPSVAGQEMSPGMSSKDPFEVLDVISSFLQTDGKSSVQESNTKGAMPMPLPPPSSSSNGGKEKYGEPGDSVESDPDEDDNFPSGRKPNLLHTVSDGKNLGGGVCVASEAFAPSAMSPLVGKEMFKEEPVGQFRESPEPQQKKDMPAMMQSLIEVVQDTMVQHGVVSPKDSNAASVSDVKPNVLDEEAFFDTKVDVKRKHEFKYEKDKMDIEDEAPIGKSIEESGEEEKCGKLLLKENGPSLFDKSTGKLTLKITKHGTGRKRRYSTEFRHAQEEKPSLDFEKRAAEERDTISETGEPEETEVEEDAKYILETATKLQRLDEEDEDRKLPAQTQSDRPMETMQHKEEELKPLLIEEKQLIDTPNEGDPSLPDDTDDEKVYGEMNQMQVDSEEHREFLPKKKKLKDNICDDKTEEIDSQNQNEHNSNIDSTNNSQNASPESSEVMCTLRLSPTIETEDNMETPMSPEPEDCKENPLSPKPGDFGYSETPESPEQEDYVTDGSKVNSCGTEPREQRRRRRRGRHTEPESNLDGSKVGLSDTEPRERRRRRRGRHTEPESNLPDECAAGLSNADLEWMSDSKKDPESGPSHPISENSNGSLESKASLSNSDQENCLTGKPKTDASLKTECADALPESIEATLESDLMDMPKEDSKFDPSTNGEQENKSTTGDNAGTSDVQEKGNDAKEDNPDDDDNRFRAGPSHADPDSFVRRSERKRKVVQSTYGESDVIDELMSDDDDEYKVDKDSSAYSDDSGDRQGSTSQGKRPRKARPEKDPTAFDVKTKGKFQCWVCRKKLCHVSYAKRHIYKVHKKQGLCVIYLQQVPPPAAAEKNTDHSEEAPASDEVSKQEGQSHEPPVPTLLVFCPRDCRYVTTDTEALDRHMTTCERPVLPECGDEMQEVQDAFLKGPLQEISPASYLNSDKPKSSKGTKERKKSGAKLAASKKPASPVDAAISVTTIKSGQPSDESFLRTEGGALVGPFLDSCPDSDSNQMIDDPPIQPNPNAQIVDVIGAEPLQVEVAPLLAQSTVQGSPQEMDNSIPTISVAPVLYIDNAEANSEESPGVIVLEGSSDMVAEPEPNFDPQGTSTSLNTSSDYSDPPPEQQGYVTQQQQPPPHRHYNNEHTNYTADTPGGSQPMSTLTQHQDQNVTQPTNPPPSQHRFRHPHHNNQAPPYHNQGPPHHNQGPPHHSQGPPHRAGMSHPPRGPGAGQPYRMRAPNMMGQPRHPRGPRPPDPPHRHPPSQYGQRPPSNRARPRMMAGPGPNPRHPGQNPPRRAPPPPPSNQQYGQRPPGPHGQRPRHPPPPPRGYQGGGPPQHHNRGREYFVEDNGTICLD